MADSIYIQSVSITPNPVTAGGKIKIEVEIYTLYPQTTLYPATTLYPGEDCLPCIQIQTCIHQKIFIQLKEE